MQNTQIRDLRFVEEAEAVPLDPQPDLPYGPTWKCSVCRTRLRTGQPHTALQPAPHAVYSTLVKEGR